MAVTEGNGMDETTAGGAGALTPQQVELVFGALPFDMTFVDEAGRVAWYSPYRIFKRVHSDIGRDVVACHSPATRPQVTRLMSELATGWRDGAEFLSEKDGRAVEVVYTALRDAAGTYRGVLEVCRWADAEPLG